MAQRPEKPARTPRGDMVAAAIFCVVGVVQLAIASGIWYLIYRDSEYGYGADSQHGMLLFVIGILKATFGMVCLLVTLDQLKQGLSLRLQQHFLDSRQVPEKYLPPEFRDEP